MSRWAELGHPIFVAARTGNLSELAPLVKTYREAWKKAGHPGEGEVYLRVPVYVADTDEKAREEPRESIMHLLRYIGDRLAASASASRRARHREPRRARRQDADHRLRGGAARTHDRRHAGRVIDRLSNCASELGLNGILAELNPGSLIPHARVLEALRLLCQEVMPRFK